MLYRRSVVNTVARNRDDRARHFKSLDHFQFYRRRTSGDHADAAYSVLKFFKGHRLDFARHNHLPGRIDKPRFKRDSLSRGGVVARHHLHFYARFFAGFHGFFHVAAHRVGNHRVTVVCKSALFDDFVKRHVVARAKPSDSRAARISLTLADFFPRKGDNSFAFLLKSVYLP